MSDLLHASTFLLKSIMSVVNRNQLVDKNSKKEIRHVFRVVFLTVQSKRSISSKIRLTKVMTLSSIFHSFQIHVISPKLLNARYISN